MTEIFMAVVVVAVMVGVFVVRSNTARQRKEAISRIESARANQSESPVADLFRDEGVPMPTSIASTVPPPSETTDVIPDATLTAPTGEQPDGDESVVETGQDA